MKTNHRRGYVEENHPEHPHLGDCPTDKLPAGLGYKVAPVPWETNHHNGVAHARARAKKSVRVAIRRTKSAHIRMQLEENGEN